MTSLADLLLATKPITLRRYSTYGAKVRPHMFVGSLMVPKTLSDGSFPVVDVWTTALSEVIISPYQKEPLKMPPIYIGAADLNRLITLPTGKRVMHIDALRGVEPAGYGFGFALYAASALATKFSGPDGIYSIGRDRSIDASDLWARMKKMYFSWMSGPLAKNIEYWQYDDDFGVDYILGQTVLDSGLVVRLGQKYGKQWASFRKPPTKALSFSLKYRAKKLEAWERGARRSA